MLKNFAISWPIFEQVCKIKDEIRLKTVDISCVFIHRVCLYQLKKELPHYLTALRNANLAEDLKTAIKVLAETVN